MTKDIFTIIKQTPFSTVAEQITGLYSINGHVVGGDFKEVSSLNALHYAATRPKTKKQVMVILKAGNWKYTEFIKELENRVVYALMNQQEK